MTDRSTLTILFLAANPAANSGSNLEQEAREISDGLVRARHRDRFKFEQRWAVTPRDIRLALLECNPQIVHFAGYRQQGIALGNQEPIAPDLDAITELKFEQEDGLAFQDDTGQITSIHANALADLFKLFSEQVNCVLLSGCYTERQAKVIAQHISYVIGMKRSLTAKAAIDFALGFYDALGAGKPIKFAYNLGCTAIQMAGLPEHLTPILYEKPELAAVTPDTNLLNSTTPKRSLKRHIQQKYADLEEEYQEIRKKLKWLKKELTIKTDSEAKYELTQRIEQYEVQLQSIEESLQELEQE